jgi:hypothetical protein
MNFNQVEEVEKDYGEEDFHKINFAMDKYLTIGVIFILMN